MGHFLLIFVRLDYHFTSNIFTSYIYNIVMVRYYLNLKKKLLLLFKNYYSNRFNL